MNEEIFDILVVGGGAAGMAAALSASRAGASVLLAERMPFTGGVLEQCVHKGFGLGYFREDMSGRAYADAMRRKLADSSVCVRTGTTVLSLSPDRSAVLSSEGAVCRIRFRGCILASGSYERTIESIPVAGTRPAGVFTAGCVQGMINRGGFDIGRRILILGSGNAGQIMGRQLHQSGKTILGIIEQRDEPGGLPRNQRECIRDCNLPLFLHSTVTRLHGAARLTAADVKDLRTGEIRRISCDTLITALGLIPDRTLLTPLQTRGTLPDWITLCGNCDFIHDIVDSATIQGEQAGRIISARLQSNSSC